MSGPERIWAFYSDIFGAMWTGVKDEGADEYIRADLVDALSDPRVKALVEQVRALLVAADGESYAVYNAALEATAAALRAIGGEA